VDSREGAVDGVPVSGALFFVEADWPLVGGASHLSAFRIHLAAVAVRPLIRSSRRASNSVVVARGLIYRALVLRFLSVTFDAQDPGHQARFWADLLGRDVREEPAGRLVPGDDAQLSLRFVMNPAAKTDPNRMHMHLTSETPADQERTVAAVLQLGGGHLDVGQLPDEGHVVLADPEGNEFCVIEAGNKFLAGCGFLGELSCDGTRDVGVFWSRALGWPLVWDENEETAIQSPYGGTKVSWGGPPVAPVPSRSRTRFDVAPVGGDQTAEVDRLIALGATHLAEDEDGTVVMADPDGNAFRLRAV
jgi:hypothetical protein